MPTDSPASQAWESEFAGVLETLRGLTRNHLLFYRLEVGRVLLLSFFGGSASAYLDRNPKKTHRFSAFYAAFEDELSSLGLKEQVLRQCILTYIVVQTLPAEVVEQLEFSKLLALTKVKDPTQRSRLAKAAVDERWPVSKLREAIDLAADGSFYDVDPAQPGVQFPVPAPAQPKKRRVGVVINRAERWAEETSVWAQALVEASPSRLTQTQRQRLRQVLAQVRQLLVQVEESSGFQADADQPKRR